MSDSLSDETLAATGTGGESRPALPVPKFKRGESLGRYVVLSKLGEGGMGVVYAAYDPELDRKVAVKVVRPDVRGDATLGGARLLREAQALARLSHPNIVNIYDVGVLDDQVWIAMEFVDGKTLKEWMAERKRTWQEALDVMRAAAVGLAAAHKAGLVHRDFKPDNVMVSEGGRVRVMDFGLARHNEEADMEASSQPVPIPDEMRTGPSSLDNELTRTGALSGTPRYMSPEQFATHPAGEASDQFSFCVVLWEVIYGERPFGGDTVLALSFSVTQGNRRPPPRGSDVPGWLRRVVERGLESDPKRRWPSVDALLAALEHSRRRRRTLWGVGALAVAGVAAGAVFAAQRVERRNGIAACEAKADPVGEVWNPDVRAKVESAMGTGRREFAATTVARILPALDEYAEQWSAVATESCVAATVEQQLDREAYARRESCLKTSLAGARMIVETFSDPATSGDALDTAVQAVNGLEQPSSCTQDARLERIPSPPEHQLQQVQSVRLAHARTQARVNLGDMAGALDEARGAVEEADGLGWKPLVAESHAMLGRLEDKMDLGEQAEASRRTAFFTAAEASADAVAMLVALDLASAISDDLERLSEAEDWYRHAQVFADRVPDPDKLMRAESLSTLAVLRRQQGKFEESRDLYAEARRIKQEVLGADHPETAVLTNNLALVIEKSGDREGARALFEEATASLEATFGSDHPQVAVALNNLATIQAQTGEKEAALASFRRALAIQEGAFGKESLSAAQVLVNLGQIQGAMGNLEARDEALSRAVPIFKESLGDKHPFYAMTLGSHAGARVEQGRLEEAKEMFLEALHIMEEVLPPGDDSITYSLDGLGRIARQEGDREAAQAYFERTLSIYEDAYGPDHPDVAYALNHLAEISIEESDFAKAQELARRALDIQLAESDDGLDLARPRFTLARAQARGKSPQEEQLDLARQALEAYETDPERFADEIAELNAFFDR